MLITLRNKLFVHSMVVLLILGVLMLSVPSSVFGSETVEPVGLFADQDKERWRIKAEEMVRSQIQARGVQDPRVLDVMRNTQRDLFVPPSQKNQAYSDYPLPIGGNQTISQPYIVALMTELLKLSGSEKVLEIGTGSGYQAAILSGLVDHVYTVEIIDWLAKKTAARLQKMGYKNITAKWGDGYKGWPAYAPFDRVIVTAAPPQIPKALMAQLKVGGIMVIPVGEFFQDLMVVRKTEQGVETKNSVAVRFVPMVRP